VKRLTDEAGGAIGHEQTRKIACTGETMQDVVKEHFPTLKVASCQPEHTARLDNRYICLSDFEMR
jgi:hypothetical protein